MAKSEFVSSFDIASGIFKKLSNEVRNLGGGDEHLRRVETDGELRRKLAELIVASTTAVEFVVKPAERVFQVWKTIQLGIHKTAEAYEQALEAAGFRIEDHARQILKTISVSQTETEIDLVVVTPASLGFKNPTYQKICDRAIELGLEKCPREVGPALRLAYKNQPLYEWLRVAMEPEADSDGRLRVFRVEHDDNGRWLYARWFDPQSRWDGVGQFLFVRPRK